MGAIAEQHPEALVEAFQNNPDLARDIIGLVEDRKAGERVSVEGFKRFYKAVYSRDLPKVDEQVAEEFTAAYYSRKGVMEEAWRGKGKSTFLRVWCPYVMGVNPVGSTTLVRINDGKAKATGKVIAELIEGPIWKRFFPRVVPDTEAGWSVEAGFNVMLLQENGEPPTPEQHSEWRRKCMADHGEEKSLLCAGIESGSIIGLHPTNGMWIDDIHDEGNTRSQAEMQKVVDLVEGNLINTWFGAGGSPAIGVFCTHWSKSDAYQTMLKTGLFKHIKLPIFTRDENGVEIPVLDDEGNTYYPIGYKVKLTWPEVFPAEKVGEMWRANPVRFGQACLCDLTSLDGMRLKADWLHEYPADKIDPSWPVYFGIDFASTADKLGRKDSDYFCLAIGRAVPGGGMVLVGGFRDRLPTHEALQKVQSLAALYPTLATVGVEKWGTGREFINLLIYSTKLPVVPFPFEKEKVLSKGQKFELELAPMFTSGRMWVSSVKDSFIRAFEDEWISWDGQKSLTRHDDALDAVYGMAYVGQGHLMPKVQGSLPVKPKEKSKSPLMGLGNWRGYGRSNT